MADLGYVDLRLNTSRRFNDDSDFDTDTDVVPPRRSRNRIAIRVGLILGIVGVLAALVKASQWSSHDGISVTSNGEEQKFMSKADGREMSKSADDKDKDKKDAKQEADSKKADDKDKDKKDTKQEAGKTNGDDDSKKADDKDKDKKDTKQEAGKKNGDDDSKKPTTTMAGPCDSSPAPVKTGKPPPTTCADDKTWVDTKYGDGTSTCNTGPKGGIVANKKWCTDAYGDYGKEAVKYCPVSCGLKEKNIGVCKQPPTTPPPTTPPPPPPTQPTTTVAGPCDTGTTLKTEASPCGTKVWPLIGDPPTTCVDDKNWWDVKYGDGTSKCTSGPQGGIRANTKWCDVSVYGDYAKEAQKYCPLACGLKTGVCQPPSTTPPPPPPTTPPPPPPTTQPTTTEGPCDTSAAPTTTEGPCDTSAAPTTTEGPCDTSAAPTTTEGPCDTSAAPKPVCADDPNWIDSEFGDGTSHCDRGPKGGIKANPSWCKDYGKYSVEAQRACPKSCGMCPETQPMFAHTTEAPPETTAAPPPMFVHTTEAVPTTTTVAPTTTPPAPRCDENCDTEAATYGWPKLCPAAGHRCATCAQCQPPTTPPPTTPPPPPPTQAPPAPPPAPPTANGYTTYTGHFLNWMTCNQQGNEGNCGDKDVTEAQCIAKAQAACGDGCDAFAIRVVGKESYGSTYILWTGASCIEKNMYETNYWDLYRKVQAPRCDENCDNMATSYGWSKTCSVAGHRCATCAQCQATVAPTTAPQAVTYTEDTGRFLTWMACNQQGNEGNCGGADVTEAQCKVKAEAACGDGCDAFAIRMEAKDSYGSTYIMWSGASCIQKNMFATSYWNLYRKVQR